LSKKYYWLKLKDDFFDDPKIKIIEEMENGKDYVIFLLKLKLKSVSLDGYLRITDNIPYDEKSLSIITNTNIDIVRQAIKIFNEFGFVEFMDDGTLYMKCIENLIGSKTAVADRVAKHRKKQLASKHIPFIEDNTNKKRYGGNYYIVFERDGQKCSVCNSKDNLCIHHIEGYDENKKENNYHTKLITLCRSCHSKAEFSKITKNELYALIDNVTKCNKMKQISNTELELELELEKEKEKEKELEKEKEKEKEKEGEKTLSPPKSKKFTAKDIEDYGLEINYIVNGNKLIDYYKKMGKTITDYKAAVRNWKRIDEEREAKKTKEKEELDPWMKEYEKTD
jgi:predicted phage replisome organizer